MDAESRPLEELTATDAQRGAFICYLECNDARRARTAAALAASGHWVCSVSNESEAMHALAKTPFDIFLIGVSGPCSRELIESLRASPLAHVKAVRVACVALARVDARSLNDIGVDNVLSFYLNDAQLGSEISAMVSARAAWDGTVAPDRDDAASPGGRPERGRLVATVSNETIGAQEYCALGSDPAEDYEVQLAWCQALLAAAAVHPNDDRCSVAVPALSKLRRSSKCVPAAVRCIDVEETSTRERTSAALIRMAGRIVTVSSSMSVWIRSQWRSVPVKVALLFFVLVVAALWHHFF